MGNSGGRPARQWATVDAHRVVPASIVTTKGLTGILKSTADDGHRVASSGSHTWAESLSFDSAKATCRWCEFLRIHRSLARRERSHEKVPEGTVSCGGELTADARRVYSR